MRVYVTVKFEAPSDHGDYYDPADFLDMASEDELREEVAAWAEEGQSLSAWPNDTDIAELWTAVQALKDEDGECEDDEPRQTRTDLPHIIGHSGDG